MALQLWMPLMGDLRNQGLGNATAELGTTITHSWEEGKVGDKASKGHVIIHDSNLVNIFNSTKFSISFWCNISETTTSGSVTETYVISCGSSGTRTQLHIPVRANGGAMAFCFYSDDYTFLSSVSNRIGKWMHIVCIYDNRKQIVYIDGEKIGERTTNGDLNIAADQPLHLYSAHTLLNDFRIYDHALSQMEVKELSKGLVLHYPLNREGWGQENLLKDSHVSVNTTSYAMHDYYFVTGKEPVEGSTYTIQLKGQLGTGKTYFGIYNSGGSVSCVSLTPTTQKNGIYRATFSWKKGSASNTYLRVYHMASSTSATSTIEWIKLEEGSIATPWCPNSSDALATTMGLNGTTEYDCSGYCNNGSKMTDTITYTSDTAKYQVSTHFNGTYDGILIENLQLSNIINTAVTYAFWVKPEGESGARSVYFGSYYGTSWSIEKTTGNVLRLYWNASPDETCSGATITDGVWQHVCITKNGTNDVKVYINGVQKWSSTAAHNNLSFPTTYRIGRDTRSNDGTPYKGLMSDFRIYATALSADDVKLLYQNCVTIDPDGIIRGQIRS